MGDDHHESIPPSFALQSPGSLARYLLHNSNRAQEQRTLLTPIFLPRLSSRQQQQQQQHNNNSNN
jgi:hypothetical protein